MSEGEAMTTPQERNYTRRMQAKRILRNLNAQKKIWLRVIEGSIGPDDKVVFELGRLYNEFDGILAVSERQNLGFCMEPELKETTR